MRVTVSKKKRFDDRGKIPKSALRALGEPVMTLTGSRSGSVNGTRNDTGSTGDLMRALGIATAAIGVGLLFWKR